MNDAKQKHFIKAILQSDRAEEEKLEILNICALLVMNNIAIPYEELTERLSDGTEHRAIQRI